MKKNTAIGIAACVGMATGVVASVFVLQWQINLLRSGAIDAAGFCLLLALCAIPMAAGCAAISGITAMLFLD